MKFTTTENTTYRAGIGTIPRAWIEYEVFTKYEDYDGDIYKKSILKYFHDNIYLWDFDFAGYEIHDFVFEDGKSFRLEYYWCRDDWAKEDESCLKHEYFIEEISIDEANVPEKKIGRDWL